MIRRTALATALLGLVLGAVLAGLFIASALPSTRETPAPTTATASAAPVPAGWIGSAPKCDHATFKDFPCFEHESRLTMSDDRTRDCKVFILGPTAVRYECSGGYFEVLRNGRLVERS